MLEICDLGNCKIDCKGCHDHFEAFNCITKTLQINCASYMRFDVISAHFFERIWVTLSQISPSITKS